MYCFLLLFNLFNSSTTDFTAIGSGTLILCNVQLTMLERFYTILAIYTVNHKEGTLIILGITWPNVEQTLQYLAEM